jgi:hypothetical protein
MKDPVRIPADTLIILTGLPWLYSSITGMCRDGKLDLTTNTSLPTYIFQFIAH